MDCTMLVVLVLAIVVIIMAMRRPKLTLQTVERTVTDAKYAGKNAREGIWWMRKTLVALGGVDTTGREIKAQKAERLSVVDKNGVAVEEAQKSYLEALDKYKKAVLTAKADKDDVTHLATIENTLATKRLAELDALEELLS